MAVLLSLSACSNAYTQFHSGSQYPENSGHCRVAGSYNRSEVPQVLSRMESNGLFFIGESAFQSGNSSIQADALQACNSIGADAVAIMIPEYVGSQTYSYQTQQYHPGQIYYERSTTNFYGSTNYNGNVYGNFGSAGYNGSAYGSGSVTTTTTGMTPGYTTTQTNYITAHRYNYGALYFKQKDVGSANAFEQPKNTRQGTYQSNDDDVESQNEYVNCMRSEGYVEPDDVCSETGTAVNGDVYWNPEHQTCMKYDKYSLHVQRFCE